MIANLKHFAIVTYAVDPRRLDGMIPDRFHVHTVDVEGSPKALLSVVMLMGTRVRFAAFPYMKGSMAQTNYRVYVRDKQTGEDGVWFIATVLDSWAVVVARHVWKLAWRKGKMRFACQLKRNTRLYERFEMTTQSRWAPAQVDVVQEEDQLTTLNGFPDLETGLVILTHPLVGFFYRSDGKVASYRVWHEPIDVKPGRLRFAHFGLLDDMGLVPKREQLMPHSILMTPEVEFLTSLPPSVIE